MSRFNESLRGIWYKFKHWFNSGGDYGHFNSTRFFLNILYLIIFFIITAIIFSNLDFFNGYELLIFRIGSVLLLVGIFFILRYIYYIGKQLKRSHSSLRNGHKVIIAILIILALIFVYFNQATYIPKIRNITDKFSISDFNPTNIWFGNKTNSTVIIPKSQVIPTSFINFLPQPWGLLIIWGIIILAVILLLRKFVFKGELPIWFIITLIIIGLVLIFQYKIPYDTVKISDSNVYCNENGKILVKNDLFGLGTWASQMGAAISCMDYKSSQCRSLCQNGQPVCQCEANLIDLVFHQKGDWVLGG